LIWFCNDSFLAGIDIERFSKTHVSKPQFFKDRFQCMTNKPSQFNWRCWFTTLFVRDYSRLIAQNFIMQFVEVDAQGDQNDVRDHLFHAAVAESRVSQTVLQLRKSAFRLDGTVDPMIDSRIGKNIGIRLHSILLKRWGELDSLLCGIWILPRFDARRGVGTAFAFVAGVGPNGIHIS